MSKAPPRKPRRGFRRALLVLALLLLVLLVAALAAPFWFDARRVSALALERAEAATGLGWRLDGEPELRWRPRPWLALPGLRAIDARGRVVVSADRLELALPWSTLRGESLRIEALRIDAPVIDVEAALEWWNAQPSSGGGPLPELDGLRITGGRLLWRGGEVDRLRLSLPRFAIGEPLAIQLDARLRLGLAPTVGSDTVPPTREPASIVLAITGTPREAPLRMDPLSLSIEGGDWLPTARMSGRLQFAPWQLDLGGELAAWPTAWPALPAPIGDSRSPIAFAIAQQGGSAPSAEAVLSLSRDGHEVVLRGVPAALSAWSAAEAGSAPLLPPIEVEASLPEVELDGVRLEGVRLRIEATDGASDARSEREPAR